MWHAAATNDVTRDSVLINDYFTDWLKDEITYNEFLDSIYYRVMMER